MRFSSHTQEGIYLSDSKLEQRNFAKNEGQLKLLKLSFTQNRLLKIIQICYVAVPFKNIDYTEMTRSLKLCVGKLAFENYSFYVIFKSKLYTSLS